jgi:hypothetical protein
MSDNPSNYSMNHPCIEKQYSTISESTFSFLNRRDYESFKFDNNIVGTKDDPRSKEGLKKIFSDDASSQGYPDFSIDSLMGATKGHRDETSIDS